MEYVRIDQIGAKVEQTLDQIRQATRASHRSGLIVRIPESVQFDMVVVDEEGWQSLNLATEQESCSDQVQGGATVERQSSTEASTNVSNDKTVSDGDKEANGTDSSVSHDRQVQTDTGASGQTTRNTDNTSDRSDSENSSRNTHVQGDDSTQINIYQET